METIEILENHIDRLIIAMRTLMAKCEGREDCKEELENCVFEIDSVLDESY